MDTQGSVTHIAAIFKFGDVSGPRAKKWPKVNCRLKEVNKALVATNHTFTTTYFDNMWDNIVMQWWLKAWYLETRGFITKKIQWHIHAGLWSLVNWWREALMRHYTRCSWILMRAAVGLMEWPRPWWWSVYPRDTLTSPFLHERRGFACMQRNYYKKYTMVLKGPSNVTDLNVLQGKAYEKPCWPQYIWDQYVLKGPSYNLEMNLNPLSIYICTHCPQVAQRC